MRPKTVAEIDKKMEQLDAALAEVKTILRDLPDICNVDISLKSLWPETRYDVGIQLREDITGLLRASPPMNVGTCVYRSRDMGSYTLAMVTDTDEERRYMARVEPWGGHGGKGGAQK
nr:MAG TPA: hypothetical protein [Caudoviricetes sp.]